MLTLVGIIIIKCLYLEAKLFGDHVCQTEIMEPEEILQWELKNRTIRTYTWCMNVPPRCSVYSHKVLNETKISVINVTKSIETCCEGFYEQNNYCISMCQDCENGLCLKGTCICQSGWDGPNCDSRILNSNEEIPLATIQSQSSSTNNYIEFSTSLTPNELIINITSASIPSTLTPISISSEDIFSTQSTITSIPNRITPIVSNTDLKGYTVTSSPNFDLSHSTLAEDYKITTSSPPSKEEMLNSFNGISFDLTSPKNSLELSEEFIYHTTNTKDHESKVSEEEFVGQYSTDRSFDTTATQQTLVTSSESTDNKEIVFSGNKQVSKETSKYKLNFTYSTITPDINLNYSKNHRLFDTTSSQQHIIGPSSISTDNEQIVFSNSKEMSMKTSGNKMTLTYFDNITITTPLSGVNNLANNVPVAVVENSDLDVDYRELGGQSVEDKSVESSKILHNRIDKNDVNLDVPKTTINYNGVRKYVDNTEESGTKTTLEITEPVLDKPNILKDEKENIIFKDNFEDSLDDLTEERYQKRSSNKNYSHNTLLTRNEADNNNLIYSVCAASATTVLILIVVIIVFTLRSARKKLEKNKEKKDVATVAVFTTSIFHSPLPDPPTFENPTYLSTVGSDHWKKEPNEEMIEVQEFNVVFQETLKNPKIEDCKQYLYDHPPSTGSYRASSEVDTLSQYNLSHKSLSGTIILEPVYDEIPSRDVPMDKNVELEFSSGSSTVDRPKNCISYVDNNSLYVNTFGRTKF